MGYPLEYDQLEPLDMSECVAYSHSLNDGILGDFYTLQLGELIRVFGKYSSSESPLLSLVKYDQTYVETDIPGVNFNNTGTYYFDIVLGDLGETTPEGVVWQDGFYVLKLYSNDSDKIYSKPIKIIRTEDALSTKEDIATLTEVLSKYSEEISSDIEYLPSNNTNASIRM